MATLLDELKTIPDPRQARGKSHPLWVLLLLVIMGQLAGYHGYRPLETFAREHHQSLSQLLGIEIRRIPSYSTFRRLMIALDFEQLAQGFEQWMRAQGQTSTLGSEVSPIDGKRIRQSLTDGEGKERFVGLVSLFDQATGVTLKLQALTQQDNSEIKVVQTLLESLQLEGLILSMDAMHAQKNFAAGDGLGQ